MPANIIGRYFKLMNFMKIDISYKAVSGSCRTTINHSNTFNVVL